MHYISFHSDTATKTWKNVDSDGYSTILSKIDDKGVASTVVVIDKTKSSDLTSEIA